MNKPDFTLDKIKFATDESIFGKAVALYEGGKVTQVEEGIRSRTAVVMGTWGGYSIQPFYRFNITVSCPKL